MGSGPAASGTDGSYFNHHTTPPMGEAKRRRQQLGSLYGTPEGSNCRVPDFVNKKELYLLPKSHPVRQYLSLSKKEAAAFRYVNAVTFLQQQGFLHRLNELPLEFAEAFVRLVGHELAMSREHEDWDQICSDLHAITDGSENRQALATWHKAENRPIIQVKNARHACYAALQGMLNERFLNVNNKIAVKCVDLSSLMLIDLIPDHLVSIASVEAGYLLHRSGSLHLIDTACGREQEKQPDLNERLWLTRLRPDGIYAIGVNAAVGGLKCSEIKGMKRFIQNYKGPKLQGRIMDCPGFHTRCADLCRLVGLAVNKEIAWMGE